MSGIGRRAARIASLVFLAVLAAAAVATTASPVSAVPQANTAKSAKTKPCNGHVELCARRLDQVTLAGAHNAYATTADGFTDSAVQTRTIREQLDAGVRALLLDVYQGTPTTDHVCTDPTPLKVAQLTRELGKTAVDGLIAFRNSQCPPAGSAGTSTYLCHDFCEGGATKFSDQLAQIRGFLVENPREVATLILEDYTEAPDIAAAFGEAGLTRFVAAKQPGASWPTLAKMISSNRRLVVFSEHQGDEPPWLMPAFREIQDTPYTFPTLATFSCERNRGTKASQLFLVNHWLGGVDPRVDARSANQLDELVARGRECAKERDHAVNLLVVNHTEVGDLVAAVDVLNGVAPGPGTR